MLSDTLTNEANMQMALFCTFFFSFYLPEIEGANDKKKGFLVFFQLIVIDALKKSLY